MIVYLHPSPRQQHGHYRCLGLAGTCRGGFATAVTSLVGLVHPNIHRSCRRNVAGRGPLSVFTVASIGVNPCPSALYQSCSAWYCSSAKNSMAGTEREGTWTALELHCLCIRVAGSSFLLLSRAERAVIAAFRSELREEPQPPPQGGCSVVTMPRVVFPHTRHSCVSACADLQSGTPASS